MRFFRTAVSFALAAFAAVASAQASTKGNAITAPIAGQTITAGGSFTITWMNIVGSTVTLTLMDGPTNGLKPVVTIVAGASNTGSYTWTVPDSIPASQTYAIRISYDSNPNNFNYSDRFVFVSDVTATATVSTASSTSMSTTSAPSSSSTESTQSTTSTESSSITTSSASTSSDTESSTTVRTSTRRSSSTSSAPTSTSTSTGAPPSAANSNLSSPLAVIMAVLAAALFLH